MHDATHELFAAQDGDPTAFERFVQLTIGDVTRFCHYLGDSDHVDDLVQDTYLRALRGLRTFRGDTTAKSWLITIARRACADSIAHQQRSRRTELTRRHHTNHNTLVDTELLLAELKDDQRQAFVLTQLLGYPYHDVAIISDCPIGTVRSRVSRARAHLAHLITQAEQAG